ncbi:MAG TPA: hypothetical protein VGO37_19915 [Steroidobacteraceae bacterium]|nr:hypothetical protein [Steroidobacteraceae bacterium]
MILTSWFFKYAYILFDHTVHGFDEPPTLDIQMLNPLDEQRPLAQVAILGLIYLAVNFAYRMIGPAVAFAIAVAALLCLPASVAILGLEGNMLKAAYPVAWVRMVWRLGPMYALVLAIIAGYSVLIALLGRWPLWLPVQIAIYLFCILSIFSVLGGALYERRDELGLETSVSPERTAERLHRQTLRESEKEVWDAYGQMRAGAHTRAWELLQKWLAAHGNAPDDYRWLCGRVAAWDDPRYVTRLTEDYVDRLLILRRTGEALDVVAARLIQDSAFRPKSAAATFEVARLAAAGGGRSGVARALLADFPERFAGDPSVPAAAVLARHLG